MTTGDIKNNLKKLQCEIKLIDYGEEIEFEKMVIGLSEAHLPILHYAFTEYSCMLSSYFSSKGYDLYAKNDFRFLEIIYRILVQEFDVKPMLTKQQFFAIGFAEVKVIMLTKILALCRKKDGELAAKSGKKKKGNAIQKVNLKTKYENINNYDEDVRKGDLPSVHEENCETIVPQNHIGDTISKHEVKRPEPHPELALTPLKERKRSDGGSDKFDSKLLDLSDIVEETFESSFTEIVESDEEPSEILPLFKVTKHSVSATDIGDSFRSGLDNANDFAKKSSKEDANDLAVSNIEDSKSYCKISSQLFPTEVIPHSLPGNVSVVLKGSSDDVTNTSVDFIRTVGQSKEIHKECDGCIMNSALIKKLTEKIERMEGDIRNLVSVNNDLSAKVVLMETSLKMVDCKHGKGKDHRGESEVIDKLDERKNIEETGEERTSDITVPYEITKIPGADRLYSPIKYTDDDIIIKDFKPMRMKDVRSLMMKHISAGDNEENAAIDVQNKTVKSTLEESQSKVSDSDSGKYANTHFLSRFVDDECPSESCNVSKVFEDEVTKQTVRNVRRRLEETERMLRKSVNIVN